MEYLTFKETQYIKYEVISYRGKEVNLLSDLQGDYYYAKIDDEVIPLGYHNLDSKSDICKLIDYKLDLITDFRDTDIKSEAQLKYFNNSGYRDIVLICRGRRLKIFLVNGQVNEAAVINESLSILHRLGLSDSNN